MTRDTFKAKGAPAGAEAALRDALQGLIDFIEIDNLPMDADAMFIAKRALAQQPAAVDEVAVLSGLLDEVRSHFTRDDDLPDDLLPRIDAALAAQQGGSDNDR